VKGDGPGEVITLGGGFNSSAADVVHNGKLPSSQAVAIIEPLVVKIAIQIRLFVNPFSISKPSPVSSDHNRMILSCDEESRLVEWGFNARFDILWSYLLENDYFEQTSVMIIWRRKVNFI
jgi:hypothetical protein